MENLDCYELEVTVQRMYEPIHIPLDVNKIKLKIFPRADSVIDTFVIDEIIAMLPKGLQHLHLTSDNLKYEYCISGTMPNNLQTLELSNFNLRKGLAFNFPPALESYIIDGNNNYTF